MKILKYAVLLLFVTGGCSSELAKRSTYETLESIRMQQCAGDLLENCSERESYNDYTRKRDKVVK